MDLPAQQTGRLLRVSLCVMIFAEVEVRAENALAARHLAEAQANTAKRRFRTAPVAHRVEIQEMVDPRFPEKGLRWVGVDLSHRMASGAKSQTQEEI